MRRVHLSEYVASSTEIVAKPTWYSDLTLSDVLSFVPRFCLEFKYEMGLRRG